MALEFSAQAKQRIERLLTQYPTKQAALLPVLHLAQDEFGYLPDEALHLVAETLQLPPAHVFGVIPCAVAGAGARSRIRPLTRAFASPRVPAA